MNRRIKFGIVVLALMVLGVGAIIVLTGRPRRRAEAHERALIARGEKLGLLELAPQKRYNMAVSVLFSSLMGGYRVPTNFPPALKEISRGVALEGRLDVRPEQQVGYDTNIERLAKIREVLVSNELGFNLDYAKGAALALPHLAQLQGSQQLAIGTMVQALAANDISNAQSTLRTAVDLLKVSSDEPIIISQLIRAAEAQRARADTWAALQSGRWGESDLADLQTRWEAVDLRSAAAPAFRMERAIALSALKDARQSYRQMSSMAGSFSGVASGSTTSGFMRDEVAAFYERFPGYWKWRSAWSYDEEEYTLCAIDAALELVGGAEKPGGFAPALMEYDRQVKELNARFAERTNHFKFMAGAAVYPRSTLLKLAAAENARRLTITAIALARYHLAKGAYPKALDELVPAYLKQVPADFMDGKPVRYRLEADGSFSMYSLGEDGVDHGGNGPLEIPWPRAATPQELEEYQKALKK